MQSFCSEEELVAKLRSLETRRNAFAAVVKEYGEKLYWQILQLPMMALLPYYPNFIPSYPKLVFLNI